MKLVAGVIGTHVSLKSMRLYIFMYFVHEGLKKPVATHAKDFYGPKGLKGLKNLPVWLNETGIFRHIFVAYTECVNFTNNI